MKQISSEYCNRCKLKYETDDELLSELAYNEDRYLPDLVKKAQEDTDSALHQEAAKYMTERIEGDLEEEEEREEERQLMESESKKTPSEIASFLRGLSDQMEKRSIIMKQGENLLTLTLPENLTLEVEVEEEGEGTKTKRSLEIEIEWYEEDIARGALELE